MGRERTDAKLYSIYTGERGRGLNDTENDDDDEDDDDNDDDNDDYGG